MNASPSVGPPEAADVRPTRLMAMTMVSDEADMLPRWIDYYGRQVGFENLLVLDDNSTDGSTEDLPCASLRLPPPPWKGSWAKTRRNMANDLSRAFLACYDVVLFSDVDEFVVPDPAYFAGLVDYFDANPEQEVVAPVAVNVVHDPRVEPSLDPSLPVLAQRRFVNFQPQMCKPLVKRIPAPWLAALHGIKAPYRIDPRLWMLHLKFYDMEALQRVSEQRRIAHKRDGKGSRQSAWPLGYDKISGRLRSWLAASGDGQTIPDFDPSALDLAAVVHERDDGFYRSVGQWSSAMADNPVRQLPQRFRTAL